MVRWVNVAFWLAFVVFGVASSQILTGIKHIDSSSVIFPDDDLYNYDYEYDDYDYDNSSYSFDNKTSPRFQLVDDFDELSTDDLKEISRLSTMEEVVEAFGALIPQASPPPLRVSTAGLISSRTSLEKKFVRLPIAGCIPELRTVELDLEHEKGVIFTPTCVRLHRCGGCCVGTSLSCQPISVEEVNIEVWKVKSRKRRSPNNRRNRSRRSGSRSGSRNGGRSRRRIRSQFESVNVKELNHTSCDCQCITQEEHCDSTIHEYSRSECKCLCKNKDEQSKCTKNNSTHIWDPKTCQCLCRDSHNCSSGEVFSHKHCRCEASVASAAARSAFSEKFINLRGN